MSNFDMQKAQRIKQREQILKSKIMGHDVEHGLPGASLSNEDWYEVLEIWTNVLENALDEKDTRSQTALIHDLVLRLRFEQDFQSQRTVRWYQGLLQAWRWMRQLWA